MSINDGAVNAAAGVFELLILLWWPRIDLCSRHGANIDTGVITDRYRRYCGSTWRQRGSSHRRLVETLLNRRLDIGALDLENKPLHGEAIRDITLARGRHQPGKVRPEFQPE